ncbi:helix-turn-helix domain-containing protein [Amphibacillus indicireducens]|uniref:Cytoskeleton protein RodZ-like C-terminal domain-containing protein n=1 Tax=Amphibacillus indicireducens TaxID=1076330 RepID=A0ABP7V512_9BACI
MQIGEKLKDARLEKGYSIEEVSRLTKIQIRHLNAIEDNNFSMIPGNFYARVFIKEYANVVGLDFKALLDEHHHEIPTVDEDVDYTQLSRSRRKSTSSKSSPFTRVLPTIIVFILLFGVVFFIWRTLQNPDGPSPDVGDEVQTDQSIGDEVSIPSNDIDQDDPGQDEADEPDETEEDVTEEPELSLVSYENAVSYYQFSTTDESIELVIESSGSNWLEIEDDQGNRLYYETLQSSGSPVSFDVSDEDFVYLRFGNPGDITITINDKEVELSTEISPTAVQVLWLYINEELE